MPEIDKALAELKNLMAYRQAQGLVEDFFGIGLTSRKNLCLNPKVSKEKKGKVVDSKCRNLTASWVRAKAGVNKAGNQQQEEGDDPMDVDQQRHDVELCNFYEVSGCFCRNSGLWQCLFSDTLDTGICQFSKPHPQWSIHI